MASERLVVHAIQHNKVGAFEHRFRMFNTKEERDQTVAFLKANQDPVTYSGVSAVMLKITIEPDKDPQLALDLGKLDD